MSHGYGSYEVENRRRLERERQAALARVRQLEVEYEKASAAAAASAADMGQGMKEHPRLEVAPTDSASTAELTAWASAAEPVITKLVREVAEVRARLRAADLADHLRAIAGSGDLATPYKARADVALTSERPKVGRDDAPSLESLTDRIESVVARLDVDASMIEREAVSSAAKAVLMESTMSAETLITQLKVLVQQVGRSSGRRRNDQVKARGLLRTLEGVIGAEADDLRQLLERVASGATPLAGVDEARIADVRARAIAEEDRLYVAEHLAAAFSDLGYDVDSEFSRDLASGVPAYAFVASSPDHAVELQLGEGQYSYRLVHSEPSADSALDAELELSLCKAVGRATADGHARGMQFTIDDHRSPGSEPVPFAPQARERRWTRASKADRLRERKR